MGSTLCPPVVHCRQRAALAGLSHLGSRAEGFQASEKLKRGGFFLREASVQPGLGAGGMNLERVLLPPRLSLPCTTAAASSLGAPQPLPPSIGLNRVPPNSCLSGTHECTLSGNRVFAVKVGSSWVRVSPKPNTTGVPLRRGRSGHRDRHTERRTVCEDGGRDLSHARGHQGRPRP